MTENLVLLQESEEIGKFIADEFARGETYVHLTDLPIAKKGRFNRDRHILKVCEQIGSVAQMNVDPMSAVERLDATTEPSPRKELFHTSGGLLRRQERIVSYWNGQPQNPGDTIDILPIDRVIDRMKTLGEDPTTYMQAALERIQEPIEFKMGSGVIEPVFNPETGSVRFDRDLIDIRDYNRIELFYRLIHEEEKLVDTIELGGGGVVFFDNHKVLHRRKPENAISRLTFRVLLHTLVDPTKENAVYTGPYL
jgi:hypothetical protein